MHRIKKAKTLILQDWNIFLQTMSEQIILTAHAMIRLSERFPAFWQTHQNEDISSIILSGEPLFESYNGNLAIAVRNIAYPEIVFVLNLDSGLIFTVLEYSKINFAQLSVNTYSAPTRVKHQHKKGLDQPMKRRKKHNRQKCNFYRRARP